MTRAIEKQNGGDAKFLVYDDIKDKVEGEPKEKTKLITFLDNYPNISELKI